MRAWRSILGGFLYFSERGVIVEATELRAGADDALILLTAKEAGRLLSLSPQLIYQMAASGVLPTLRIPRGRSVRIPRDELLSWVKGNSRPGSAT